MSSSFGAHLSVRRLSLCFHQPFTLSLQALSLSLPPSQALSPSLTVSLSVFINPLPSPSQALSPSLAVSLSVFISPLRGSLVPSPSLSLPRCLSLCACSVLPNQSLAKKAWLSDSRVWKNMGGPCACALASSYETAGPSFNCGCPAFSRPSVRPRPLSLPLTNGAWGAFSSAHRTPIGRARRGQFKDTPPDDLLYTVLKAVRV